MDKAIEYRQVGFIDHVVDVQTGAIVRQGTPLGESTVGYMDQKLAEVVEAVNSHSVYINDGASRRMVATRIRDPSKPDYGMGGGVVSVALEAVPYTGAEEVSIVVEGKEYAVNISTDGASSTNGNIKLDGVETKVYNHPTGAGSEHIPAGGTTGQILTKTASGYAFEEAPTGIPDGGNEGQVLTKTASGYAFADAPRVRSGTSIPADMKDGEFFVRIVN